MRPRNGLRAAVAGLAIAAGALAAAPASASYHEMKISEVHFGGAGILRRAADALRRPESRRGHYIRTYGPGGATSQTFQIPSAVPNGQSQRTILIGSNTVTRSGLQQSRDRL